MSRHRFNVTTQRPKDPVATGNPHRDLGHQNPTPTMSRHQILSRHKAKHSCHVRAVLSYARRFNHAPDPCALSRQGKARCDMTSKEPCRYMEPPSQPWSPKPSPNSIATPKSYCNTRLGILVACASLSCTQFSHARARSVVCLIRAPYHDREKPVVTQCPGSPVATVDMGIWVKPDGLEWVSPKFCRVGLKK